ncbi:MAG: hypothetical protein EOO93_27545, partial [Pedobacter sp.]
MYNTLLRQYQLVISSRESVFKYCEGISNAHLIQPLATINNESIINQMLHTANCYVFWIANCAMQQHRPYFKNEEHTDLPSVRQVYEQVNLMVNEFLHHFNNAMELPQVFMRQDGNRIERSPLDIFTHLITHEFHHKGQIVNMSRQLGYT